MRTTFHTPVGDRAEVSVGGRVEVRRVLGRARVRRAPASPLRTRQLEASREGVVLGEGGCRLSRKSKPLGAMFAAGRAK